MLRKLILIVLIILIAYCPRYSRAEVKQITERERERLKEGIGPTRNDLVELHLRKAELAGRMHLENIRIKQEFEEYMAQSQFELKKVQREFQDYITQSQIEISELKKGLVVSFVDRVFFDSGKAEIRPQAYPILEKVAQVIREHPHRPILIKGHTDNVPIGPKLKLRYAVNWELSTARAVAILRYLLVKHHLPPEQLIAAGYSKYQPLSNNDTPPGRQRNRRVEIVILPEKLFLQPEISSPEK